MQCFRRIKLVIKDELVKKIKDFGLNSYEAKLWLALLSRGISTAGELSDISTVPRSRAYDVLESLEKKGFIIVKLGKPIKYLAVSPREVLDRVKKKIINDAQVKTNLLEQLKESEMLQELNTLHNMGSGSVTSIEKTGAFKGKNKIFEHLSLMIKSSKKEVLLVSDCKYARKIVRSLLNDLNKANKRGINVRLFTDLSQKKDIESLAPFVKVHNIPQPARCVISDSKEMVIILTNQEQQTDDSDHAIWFNNEYFVNNYQRMIEKDHSIITN